MPSSPPAWLAEAVEEFGRSCQQKLAGPGDREAAIRAPLEALLHVVGDRLNVRAVFHDEVRDLERRVRPDYGVSVNGVITGYVEVKKPGESLDPDGFTGHNREQWERQRDLPNLLYTNGTEWRLFRDGEAVGDPVYFTGGPLTSAGSKLRAPAAFERVVTQLLSWQPAAITSVGALVRAVAPLTRLLRGEVLDQLAAEKRRTQAGASEHEQPFLGLAQDWRALLFPTGDDHTFADGYAQTVAFALLLARSEAIDLTGESLHAIGERLGPRHSLMGRALQLLTDEVRGDFKVTLDLLVRIVGAVEWDSVRHGRWDTYLHLYEHFLDEYDPELRKQSGVYYTPREVVEEMVRLADEALKTRLGTIGFLDPNVLTVDPAMGTGTYLHAVIERAAEEAVERNGPGLARGVIEDVAKRLVGFELQMGPYAVAELRTTDLLRTEGVEPPGGGMRMYVTNTLDDPYADVEQIAHFLQAIAVSRRRANKIKGNTPVTVVIGNPPYHERAEGQGGWVESGSEGVHPNDSTYRPLDDFRASGNGLAEYVLKNLYIYFWRWATWKVFDAHRQPPSERSGVVCFISTSGYLRGPGFKGMREYLRRTCSDGWIIDVSPEGMRPDVPTRIFRGVQQPLAIGLFVRRMDTREDKPATIWYRAVTGRRDDKYQVLREIGLDSPGWRDVRADWQAPFTPVAESAWDDWPALSELMPWTAPGVKPNRTWVYAPSPDILRRRWDAITTEPNNERKRELFKETGDRNLSHRSRESLPGVPFRAELSPFGDEAAVMPESVRVGYRSFDRQWIIPDRRLIDRVRPELWAARIHGQIFMVEQHAHPISSGPGLVFSALIPDMDYFKGSEGGRVLPLLHPDGSANLAPGLTTALAESLGVADVAAGDVLAYVAAVVAHPGFTARFTDELTTPGIRVPITTDGHLWQEAVALGRQIVWLQTFGEAFPDAKAGRLQGNVRLPTGDPAQPLSLKAVSEMPNRIAYDAERRVLCLGDGEWGPVTSAVWEYAVGGQNVIRSWFNYRKAVPGGRKSSPLDNVHTDSWLTAWSVELIDLLTVLTRLTDLEPAQADLLDHILSGPLATRDALAAQGVRWPDSRKDRKPRYPLKNSPSEPPDGQQHSLMF